MQVRAISKDVGISPKKMRLVVNLVRGKKVEDALAILTFSPTPAARAVAKVVKSAAANADNNLEISPSGLRIASISADKGHVLKRFRPRARGRVSPILKRSSHITVVVAGED
jgi:large subunit ribosomal protein L22